MDFLKTLLIYMVALLSAGTAGEVAPTPYPPSVAPTAYVTYAPTRVPTSVPTATPSPSPTPVVYTTLYVGDRGENVKKLQRRLTELGYLNDAIDGIYGQKTKRAVERFQYYNGINNDGVAGQSTQYMLYESRSVIYAPPDITQAPTPSPTPYVQRQVYVPIYYVDQQGALLARTGITLYASGTIYADGDYIPTGYYLASSASVYVYLNGNSATPASATFTCARQATATPTPSAPVYIPVYYMAEDNTVLYITSCSLTRGITTTVYAQDYLVDSRYKLISAATVDVYVNQSGTATPASIIFRYRDVSTPVPTETPAPIAYPVYYLTEFDEILYADTVYLPRDMASTVYANLSLVPPAYTLINASSVQVNVARDGSASPAQVNFRFRVPVITDPPVPVVTDTPTPVVTDTPTPVVTDTPTPVVTDTPTPVVTDTPTPVVTDTPTPVVTDTPTPVVTDTPTPVVTDTPAPVAPSGVLDPGGTTVVINGETHTAGWYKNGSGEAYIAVDRLAEIMNVTLADDGASKTGAINGHTVFMRLESGAEMSLVIDGTDYTASSFRVNNALYLNASLLSALGVNMTTDGDVMTLTY